MFRHCCCTTVVQAAHCRCNPSCVQSCGDWTTESSHPGCREPQANGCSSHPPIVGQHIACPERRLLHCAHVAVAWIATSGSVSVTRHPSPNWVHLKKAASEPNGSTEKSGRSVFAGESARHSSDRHTYVGEHKGLQAAVLSRCVSPTD